MVGVLGFVVLVKRRVHLAPMRRNVQKDQGLKGQCVQRDGGLAPQHKEKSGRGASVRYHVEQSTEFAALIEFPRRPTIDQITGKGRHVQHHRVQPQGRIQDHAEKTQNAAYHSEITNQIGNKEQNLLRRCSCCCCCHCRRCRCRRAPMMEEIELHTSAKIFARHLDSPPVKLHMSDTLVGRCLVANVEHMLRTSFFAS